MVEIILALIGAATSVLTVLISKKIDVKVEKIDEIKKEFKEEINIALKPIKGRLNDVELSSNKNYIVRFLKDVEQGNIIDEVEEERFYEIYKRYHELGGNSYIDHKVEKLRNDGKL